MIGAGRVLRGRVGTGMENATADVIAAKRAMRDLGLYDPPPEGIGDDIDAGFDRAIRAFQHANGLAVDGVMEPGGETERNLVAATTGEGFEPPPSPDRLALRRGVGAGGANDTADVGLVKRAMGSLGRYAYDRTRPPPPYIDSRLVDSIRVFQRDNGLFDDGLVNPDGETLPALKREMRKAATKSAADVRRQPEARQIRPSDKVGLKSGTVRRGADAIERGFERFNVDGAERDMRNHLDDFRRERLPDAVENLEHYLSASGTPRTLSIEHARSLRPIREAEIANRERFARGTFIGETIKNPEPRKLKALKDGETLSFSDSWDTDHDSADFLKDIFGRDRNFAYAFGRAKVRSQGDFRARRTGDTIRIEGVVTHGWHDDYDFHDGQPGSRSARVLERNRKAHPFQMGAEWRQGVTATVKIKNGRLSTESIEWRDLPNSDDN